MKPITKPLSEASIEIQTAFKHVKSFFQNIDRVCYDRDTRWHYTDGDRKAPSFKNIDIDVGILEDGQSSLTEYPVVYIDKI